MHTSRIRKAWSILILIGCGLVVQGCGIFQGLEVWTSGAKVNPGNGDYRRVAFDFRTDNNRNINLAPMQPAYFTPSDQTPRFRIRMSSDGVRSSSPGDTPQTGSTPEAKDAPASNGTTAGDPSEPECAADSIRVSIRTAYIHRSSETVGLSELAVLANVKLGNPIAVSEPLSASRVFHYEEGVRTGEFLRFRDSLILFGPISYSGGDLHFRLTVMEMDQKDNKRTSGMIKTLAAMGGTVYPPSAPLLGALEKIGSSLLDNNSDDLDLDFRFTLAGWPCDETIPQYASNWLTPGYYIVVVTDDKNDKRDRVPERLSQETWDKLALDIQRGELVWKDGEQKGQRFSEASYIVLLIEKGFDPTVLDTQETLASLQLRIEGALKDDPQNVQKRIDIIKEVLEKITKAKVNQGGVPPKDGG